MALEFSGTATPLSEDDIANAAKLLNCEAAAVHAVCDVESSGGGFLPDKRPKILFEAHIFSSKTGHIYDASHPNISSRVWNRTLYGPGGIHQYDRLAEAIALNRAAALQSASWGMFQVMGMNFAAAGFDDVEAFVQAMTESEGEHLNAFANFCKANHLDSDLAKHDWAGFARGYNGAGYAANQYDTKLAAAYQRHL